MEVRAHELRLLGELEPVDAARHPDIGDQQIDPMLPQKADRLVAVRRGEHVIALIRQRRADDLADLGLVVDQQYRVRPRHIAQERARRRFVQARRLDGDSFPPSISPPLAGPGIDFSRGVAIAGISLVARDRRRRASA